MFIKINRIIFMQITFKQNYNFSQLKKKKKIKMKNIKIQ